MFSVPCIGGTAKLQLVHRVEADDLHTGARPPRAPRSALAPSSDALCY